MAERTGDDRRWLDKELIKTTQEEQERIQRAQEIADQGKQK